MSSSVPRQLHEDDAERVAALFVQAFGDARRLYERVGMHAVRRYDNWELQP